MIQGQGHWHLPFCYNSLLHLPVTGTAFWRNCLLGDWIITAGPERVTPEYPPRGKPAPLDRPMFLERLDRVRRATRHVATTRWQHRRKSHLISANEQHEKGTHESIYCDGLRDDSCDFTIDPVRQISEFRKAQAIR